MRRYKAWGPTKSKQYLVNTRFPCITRLNLWSFPPKFQHQWTPPHAVVKGSFEHLALLIFMHYICILFHFSFFISPKGSWQIFKSSLNFHISTLDKFPKLCRVFLRWCCFKACLPQNCDGPIQSTQVDLIITLVFQFILI